MMPRNTSLARAPLALAILCLALLSPLKSYAQSASSPSNSGFFDYNQTPPTATETPYKTLGGMTVEKITYPSPVTTPFAVNNTVTAFFFLPSGPGPHPAMVVMTEWLPKKLDDEFRFCEGIARAHIAALLIVPPYSMNRRPTPSVPGAELLTGNVPQMVAGIRQAVLDARRGLDWLSARPDVDPQRLGVSGISLGGIIAPLIAGVDRRAKVLLTIVGGADVADIFWSNPMLRGFKPELRKLGYTRESLKAALAPIEPAHALAGFDPKNALLFNGRYDIFIKPQNAEALAKALGGAPIVWLNTGHYGPAFSEDEIDKIGGAFLQSRFFPDAPPFTPPDTIASRTIKLGFLIGGREGLSPALAYQALNFDRAGRYSLDAQLTLHGLSAALSARINLTTSIGLEYPLLRRARSLRPFVLLHFTL